MGLSEEIRQKLINSFKAEQKERVQNITEGLLALEKSSNETERQKLLETIFREAHSLKGAARAVNQTLVTSIGHGLESLLIEIKEDRLDFSASLFDLMYQSLDAIELVMHQLDTGDASTPATVLALLTKLEEAVAAAKSDESPTPTKVDLQPSPPVLTDKLPATPEPQPHSHPNGAANAVKQQTSVNPANGHGEETIRVSVNKLDALMAQFSELIGVKIRAEQRLTELQQQQQLTTDWQKSWQMLRGNYNRLHSQKVREAQEISKDVASIIDFSTKNQDYLRDIGAQTKTLYRQFSNDVMRLSLIIDELQEEIKRIRMLPLTTITTTFGRMVRDLAREQNKQIKFTIIGGETELDKRVLELVKDPLIHLLRNAVDHGIESSQERRESGKSDEGLITLEAAQQGNNVIITVSDDGQGLDLPQISQAAIHKGVLTPDEAQKLSPDEIAQLIFKPGFSTRKIITDLSGRGVGMDVVRQNVQELHGALSVDFQPKQGTKFVLTLPLTLASSRGLLVQAGKQTFAIPLNSVSRMIQIEHHDISSINGRAVMTYQGKPIALAWLSQLLELTKTPQTTNQLMVVIIQVAEKQLGLVVDNLVGEQEIVVQSLGKQLVKVGGIAGATVLGTGEVILVLHLPDLVSLAVKTISTTVLEPDQTNKHPQKTILVVDDSITTRTLEKNILEAVGYEVKLATNGKEALNALTPTSLPDLIVSDVDMPQLDGFELTAQLKGNAQYKDIPVILVTSLESTAHKARGIEVGADAYIVKNNFDQGNLLDIVKQLV